MKATVFILFGVMAIPMLLYAQNDYWFKKGMDEKKPEKQIEYFTKSIKLEGATDETYLHRGDAYKKLALDRVYNHRGIVIVFGNSDTHNAQLMYEKARTDYTQVIRLNPKCSDAYINRSEVYWQQGLNDKALADLSALIKIDSQNAKAYLKRGFIYQNNYQEYPKAILDVSKAIEIDPNFKDAYLSRAYVYNQTKQYDDAMADCNKLIEIDPNYVWAYGKRGDVFSNLGQYEKTLADYDKTIKMDSKNYSAYNNRGCIYLMQNQYEKALRDFDKAISSNSIKFASYYNMGYAYLQQNKFDKALKYLNQSLEIYNFIDANLDMALVYYTMGNRSEAKTYLDKAKALVPRISETFNGISHLGSMGHNWTERDIATLNKIFEELK